MTEKGKCNSVSGQIVSFSLSYKKDNDREEFNAKQVFLWEDLAEKSPYTMRCNGSFSFFKCFLS